MIPNKSDSNKFWDSFAQFYATHYERLNVPAAMALANTLRIEESRNILEVGCGSGEFAFQMLKSLKKPETYTAVDFSKEMIDLAKKKREEHQNLNQNINPF